MWILIALGLVLLSIVSIGLFIFFGYRWSWTGFGETSYTKANGKQEVQPKKYFWDWLDLFLIPLALALVTVIFSFWQSSRQENIENQRAQYAALEEYLDQIGTLSLDRGLRTSHVDDDVRDLARARTLTILDMLSPERKPRVLEFLNDMQLVQPNPPDQKEPITSLKFANLREVNLVKRHLLKGADLEHADMNKADLYRADLSNANLRKVDLTDATLSGVVLSGADLTKAHLNGADGLNCQQAEQADSLVGATMPDGQTLKDDDHPDRPTLEEWLKNNGCEKGGENNGAS